MMSAYHGSSYHGTDYNSRIGSTHGSISTITSTVKSEAYQEHLRRKQHNKLQKTTIGPGSRQFKYGIGFAIFGCLLVAAGAIMIGLTLGQKHLFFAEGSGYDFIGPALLVFGILALGIAAYFFYRARRKSNMARQHFAFRPAGASNVNVVNTVYQPDTTGLKSGTATANAYKTPSICSTPSRLNGSVSDYNPDAGNPYTPTASLNSAVLAGRQQPRPSHRLPSTTSGYSKRKAAGGMQPDVVPSYALPAPVLDSADEADKSSTGGVPDSLNSQQKRQGLYRKGGDNRPVSSSTIQSVPTMSARESEL